MGNDRRDFDMVIGLADELRRFQKEGAAMLAGAREYIPLRRRIGMKRAVRAGVRLAPLSLGRLAFLARGLVSLARRCVGIFRRLRRQIEFGTQCRVVGAQCFDFPGQTFDRLRLRKNEADKRFLIKRIKRIAIHSQLESTRDSAVKLSQLRQLLPNSNSARNEDVSNCRVGAARSSMKRSWRPRLAFS